MANRNRRRGGKRQPTVSGAQTAPPVKSTSPGATVKSTSPGATVKSTSPGATGADRSSAGSRSAARATAGVGAGSSSWQGPLDLRRILIFIGFSFGIAWAVAAYLYATGGLLNRAPDDTLFGAPTALILLAVVYMGAPTFANLLTRLVTREGFGNLWLEVRFRAGWRYWAIAWFLPGLLTILGGAIFFALFPQYLDRDLSGFRAMLAAAAPDAEPPQLDPVVLILLGAVQGILIAPLVNGPATFGEEFGWRAYLLQKLMPLGWRKASIWMGVIWGVWHWPVIAMGHNYGLEYPGAPWGGLLVFVWFCFCMGTILGWLTLRAGSVWPAVIGHAAINGIAALGVLMVINDPNPLLGPLPVGVVGMVGFSAVALWMFWRKP